MRRLLLLVLFLFSSTKNASGLIVEKYEMGVDILLFRHFTGGKSESWVKKYTGAEAVSVGGFLGKKKINGKDLIHGLDLWVLDGKERIRSHYKDRPIIASYADGTVMVHDNYRSFLAAGKALSAQAGMKIPPKPNERLLRQFWATKGRYYYRVEMVGTRWDCLRLMKRYGFEKKLFLDGGTPLQRGFSATHATVYHLPRANELPIYSLPIRLASR